LVGDDPDDPDELARRLCALVLGSIAPASKDTKAGAPGA